MGNFSFCSDGTAAIKASLPKKKKPMSNTTLILFRKKDTISPPDHFLL
jgi:hypothetical protein